MDWKREISVRDLGRAAAAAGLWKLRSLRQAARRERRPLRLPSFRPRRRATGASTPRGAARRIVGLKIGASQLAAAHVVNNGSVELVQLARRPLDRGIVVGGDLRDPQALVGALRDFFKENRLPRRDVRLGISSNRIVVRTFDLADVEGEKQIENAVRFRAQEVLPVPVDDAVLDYRVLREEPGTNGTSNCRVLLAAVHRDFVTRYADACKRAGLRLIGVDLEAFALARAVAPVPETGAEAAAAVASIGYDRTTFAVTDGTTCDFTRVFDWGGASLDREIARALDLSPSQAEPLKCALRDHDFDDPAVRETARAAALEELQRFARELVASLAYYQNQPRALPVGEVVVTGGSSALDGLAEELERLAGLPVRIADPLEHLRVGKSVRVPDQVGSFAIAIGLGIES